MGTERISNPLEQTGLVHKAKPLGIVSEYSGRSHSPQSLSMLDFSQMEFSYYLAFNL